MADQGTVLRLPVAFLSKYGSWRVIVDTEGKLCFQWFDGSVWTTVAWLNQNGEFHPVGGIV